MKAALIGYGYWGKNIARNIAQSEHFELDTICDLNQNSLAKADKIHPGVNLTTDYTTISDEIEIVAPIVPVDLHFKFADYFLDQNKHVLLTKPFTKTYEEAQMLIDKANSKGLTIFADHTFIFNPAVRKIKELLPKLGDVFFVISSRLNLGLYQPDVNVVYDLMPHDLSIINYLFESDVESATTSSFNAAGLPQEDFAQTSIIFENDLKAFINVSWLSPFKVRDFIIIGSEGMISYNDNSPDEKVKFYNKKIKMKDLINTNEELSYTTRINYKTGDLFVPHLGQQEALSLEMEEFYKAINNKEVRDFYNSITLKTMNSLEKVVQAQNNVSQNTKYKKSA